MVGTQQARDHHYDVQRDQGERSPIPPAKHEPLERQIRKLTSRQESPGVTGRAHGGFNVWTEISTALQLVLYPQSARCSKCTRPLCVDLALKIERAVSVGHITWSDKEGKGNPGKEGVHGEKAAVVHEDASPAHEGSEDADGSRKGGYDELRAIANTDNICAGPGIEPC